jgi:hypothetical protein
MVQWKFAARHRKQNLEESISSGKKSIEENDENISRTVNSND